jgi:uncharacterized delta-60 repeat protein
MKYFFTTTLGFFCFYLCLAQTVSLDPNFGNNGQIDLGYANPRETIIDVLHTSEGNIFYLANARTRPGQSPVEFIFALDANGNPLTTFGNQGRLVFSNVPYSVNQLAMDTEGRLITLGIFDTLYINRLLPNGAVDSSFANNGTAQIATPEDLTVYSALELLLQPDDRIIVGLCVGTSSERRLRLHRLLPDGGIDSTFGQAGIVEKTLILVGGTSNCVVRLTNNQDIVVAMSISNRVALLRFNAQGILDQSFGENGIKQVVWFGRPQTMSIDPSSGHFWLAGYNGTTPPYSIWVLHCDESGNKIEAKTIGGNTRYLYLEQTLSQNYPDMLTQAPDQRWYLTVSQQETQSKTHMSVIKLTESLTRDSSFGINGMVEKAALTNGFSFGGWLNNNGQLVVAGTNNNELAQWILETNASEAQYTEHNVLSASAGIEQLSIDNIGNVLAARTSSVQTGIDLLKINPVGDLHLDFGSNGVTQFRFPIDPVYTYILKIKPQKDQKQLIAWYSNGKTYLNRILENGGPDSTFNQNGLVKLLYPLDTNETVEIRDILVEPDQKIVMGGRMGSRTFLVRLLPNGQLDLSFGVNGWARTDQSTLMENMNTLIKANNNRYYMGGDSYFFSVIKQCVISWLDNGQLNPDFGVNGILQLGTDNSPHYGVSLQQLNDNELLLLGRSYVNGWKCSQHKIKLNGSLVTTFGNGGYNLTDVLSKTLYQLPAIEDSEGNLTLISQEFVHPIDSVLTIRFAQLKADGSLNQNFGQLGIIDCFLDSNLQVYTYNAQRSTDGNLYIGGSSLDTNLVSVAKIWKISGSVLVSASHEQQPATLNMAIAPNPRVISNIPRFLPSERYLVLLIYAELN